MQLNETLQSLLRRWYLVLLGLLLTAGMSWYAYSYIQPTYEAQGSILLMPAKKIVGHDGNPYLYLNGMTEVVDVLVRRSSSSESVDPVVKQFAGSEISTTADRTTSSPVVIVDISAPTADTALDALKAALITVTRNLDSMQNELKVPPQMRISSRELVVDDAATVNAKMQTQVAIVVAGAGLAGTLMLTGFIDGVLQTRRTRKSGKVEEDRTTDELSSSAKKDVERTRDTTPVALLASDAVPHKIAVQRQRSKP